MKRTLILITFTMLMSMVVGKAFAADFAEGGISYNIITTTTVEVTSGSSYSGDIVIPSTVASGAYTVVRIGDSAFKQSNVTSLTIPNTVQKSKVKLFKNALN